jgi:putative methylase
MGKRALERRLSAVAEFEEPRIELEQYPTPADLAAHLVHLADVHGDIGDETVLDLGTGTGMLAIGAATRAPTRVIGLDRDSAALRQATENERRIDPARSIDWVLGDGTDVPLCPDDGATVLMNPPFGAQRGNEHVDRAFLETTAALADVSYSIHNEDSMAFVESFTADEGGEVTHAFRAALPLSRQFEFQRRERTVLDAEVFRIEWR